MKAIIYRNNSAYELFLAPAVASRDGFETQAFPQGTSETEITTWLAEHADWLRSMKKVYMDQTCYEAGEALPSGQPDRKNWNIWMDVSTNYGGFDHQVFQKAASELMTRATVEETIAEVVKHLLAKEVPTHVFVVQENMGDHDLFGSLSAHGDRTRTALEDAEKLRAHLATVIGKPVTVISQKELWNESSGWEKGMPWVFYDRHNEDSKIVRKYGIGDIFSPNAQSNVRWFRVPIENLVEDAIAFGIDFDTEAYSRTIREIVATW